MKGRSLAIVGCGDLGERVAGLLADEDFQVIGLRRDASRLPAGLQGVSVDYSEPASLAVLESLAADYLLLTLKPLGRDAAGYRAGFDAATAAVLAGLGNHRPRGVIMVSSTRVYAEDAGGWIDEDSPLATADPAALAIVHAEQRLLESGLPVCVVRSAGLYGGDSAQLLRRVAEGELCPAAPPRYANRVHRDDLAGLLAHLLRAWEQGAEVPRVINAVDDAPVPQHEVERWLADRLGVVDWREVARPERQGAGKRCANRRLHALGYRLRFPDYRAGYAERLQG